MAVIILFLYLEHKSAFWDYFFGRFGFVFKLGVGKGEKRC